MKTLLIAFAMILMTVNLSFAQSPEDKKIEQNDKTPHSTEKLIVVDYKSFKRYVELERSGQKTLPPTIETGAVKGKLKKLGIEVDVTKNWARSKDKKRIAYFSPDKKGVIVVDAPAKSVNIFNSNGAIVCKIYTQKPPVGLLGFSETRLFDFVGGFDDYDNGFYIYDLSGKLLKKVEDGGLVDAFMVSNGQKNLVVASELSGGGGAIILYDMDGNEKWRLNTAIGDHSIIQFSSDDKFLLVKMPVYVIDPQKPAKNRRYYLFDVTTGQLLASGDYEE